jgi:hypothetical protein
VTPIPNIEIGEGGQTSVAPAVSPNGAAEVPGQPEGFFDQDLD